mmetsp:Transcript_70355/g.168525  ORF Transcript_70355/g.168525 Transcript_70355/m.168525 type:complete len:274 (+) Transcript_70355:28-849(+)
MEGSPAGSNLAIRPIADRWGSEDGSFPPKLIEGNFPGVRPNDPMGTSEYIGMHRDGEDTLGQWARAPSSSSRALPRQKLAVRGRMQALEQVVGSDVTGIGEENRPTHVPGAVSPMPGATSWIVGEHRTPMWSESQTYACGTSKPCAQGKADKSHFFQRDTNPFVDRRRVFDAEAQASVLKPGTGKDVFPWDPTRDPQLYPKADGRKVSCEDGVLRNECFAPPGTEVASADGPSGSEAGPSPQQKRAAARQRLHVARAQHHRSRHRGISLNPKP